MVFNRVFVARIVEEGLPSLSRIPPARIASNLHFSIHRCYASEEDRSAEEEGEDEGGSSGRKRGEVMSSRTRQLRLA